MRSNPADGLAQSLALLGRRLIAACQHNDTGSPQTAWRLAQQAARQQVAVAPRGRRIDQHDIEVARQPAMLKAVVEHQHFALQLLDGGPRQGDAVGPLQVRHVGQVLFQHQRLVVAAARAAVTAAEDGHAAIEAAIEAGDILDARRLAGAASVRLPTLTTGTGTRALPSQPRR